MPRYEYRCGNCKQTSTVMHASAEQATECPKCNISGSLTKLLSAFSTAPPPRKVHTKVGEVTEDFIATSREELQQQKNDLTKNR